MEFHVSLSGKDSNSGTEEAPFFSIQKAKGAARDYAGKEDVLVLIHQGTYRLEETLSFDSGDGGTEDFPVTYRAWENDKVFITGSIILDKPQWKPWKDGIYVTPADFGGRDVDQLFVNGRLMDRARFPSRHEGSPKKKGYTFFSGELSLETARSLRNDIDEAVFPRAVPEGAYFNAESFSPRMWKHPEKAVVHAFQARYWGNLQFHLKEVDRKNSILWFGEGGHQIGSWICPNPAWITGESCFFIENVFEELDTPGEWYYDDEAGLLYFYPLPGLDLHTALIELPMTRNLIDVQGTQRKPVKNLHFSGFCFRQALTSYFEPYDMPSNGDWALYRGGALFFEGTAGCTVEACAFTDLGGNGVFFSGYSRNNHVKNCYFTRLGDSAVCMVGNYTTTNGTQKNFPFQCSVTDCRIHHLGIFGKQVAGVFIAVSSRITVSRCHIFDLPRAAVCLNDGFCGGHLVEHNRIHDTCLETSDHGPFNSWGRGPYYCRTHSHGGGLHDRPPVCHEIDGELDYTRETIVIRGNYFKDSRGWGIDLDDGSCNYQVYNNICVGISIKLRDGTYRTVENNIFYKGANAPSFHMGHVNNHDIFRRNIIVMSTEHAVAEHDADFKPNVHNGAVYELHRPPMQGPWFLEDDHNLFWSDCGAFKAKASLYTPDGVCAWTVFNLDSWREMGYDVHSLFADPLFEDPENGNFLVKPESPALKLGFVNFSPDCGPGAGYTAPYERDIF